jgi:diacylglycerol kinase family enzyme
MPCGHGNCLARALDVKTKSAAVAALESGRVESIDLIGVRGERADGSTFDVLAASTLALGYVADVVHFGRRYLPALGTHAYAVASFITGTRSSNLSIAIGEEPSSTRRLTGIVVNNTPDLANFRAFPAARMDDGRVDVMLLAAGRARQVLHNLAVVTGRSTFGPLRLAQTDALRIAVDNPCAAMIDGEFFFDVMRLEVRCVPKALRVVRLDPGSPA